VVLALVAVAFSAGPLAAQGQKAAEKAMEKAPKAGKAEGKESDPAEALAKPQVALADFWVLDFKLQKLSMVHPGEGIHRGDSYWYMLYQIENKSGKEREAFIAITAKSNKSKTYASIWLPDVEELIERKCGKLLWGKNDEVQILKERSEKNAISAEKGTFNYFPFKSGKTMDCVAIFNKLDPGATSITITIEGLSNDLHLMEKENGPRQIESRIFVVELERPGDEYEMNLDHFQVLKSGWAKKTTDIAQPKEKEGAGKKNSSKGK
jgi:hypothetical protein